MSKLGSMTAFSAEAALWIAGAALIAGAAGVQLKVSVPVDLSSVTGSQSAASASATAIKSAAPSASPNDYAALTKFLLLESSPDFQFNSVVTMSESFDSGDTPVVAQLTGQYESNGPDESSSFTTTVLGTSSVEDTVTVGGIVYKSIDGKNWTRSEVTGGGQTGFLPQGMTFTDAGVETRQGVQLHRLTAGPADVVNKAFGEGVGNGATDTAITFTLWINDDGVLAAIDISGTMDVVMNEAPVKVTIMMTYEVTATSGITIKAPI